jgi:hypothetical protein
MCNAVPLGLAHGLSVPLAVLERCQLERDAAAVGLAGDADPVRVDEPFVDE